MRSRIVLACVLAAAAVLAAARAVAALRAAGANAPAAAADGAAAADPIEARQLADFEAIRRFRPGFAFWQHVFTLPDHQIAYGSALDGRLLVLFPARGDWARAASWADPRLAGILDGHAEGPDGTTLDLPGLRLSRRLSERREQVAQRLEAAVGPVLHNATRGDALLKNIDRYGPFVAEWGLIYERFGVPAHIGLGQVVLESGLDGRRRSEAGAVGFCQWMRKNWARLRHFAGVPLEGQNQTTQAPYCAAYLSVLATKYGSFIPALSEHNAGGTNVGRTLVTGEHLGAADVRTRYLLGSKLARDLRTLPGRTYDPIHRTYGPRSYAYAEMVFGNTFVVRRLTATIPQTAIHAMRTPRALRLREIVERTGLTAAEVRRFNPALVDRVPARGTLYLPSHVAEFGDDVAFWRRPADAAYAAVLHDFLRLEPGPERWDDPAFAPVLAEFRRRFRQTGSEEGAVMDTVLAYAMDQAYTSGRRELVARYRSSPDVPLLIRRGVQELDARQRLQPRPLRAAVPAGPDTGLDGASLEVE